MGQMTFGTHKGEDFDEVPATYLIWVIENRENIENLPKDLEEYLFDIGPYLEIESEREHYVLNENN